MTTVTSIAFSAPAACERLQREDDDDVAAFHVDDAGPLRRPRVDSLEFLKRTVALEHRIEMADEQHLRAAAWMRRRRGAPRDATARRRSTAW